VIATTKRQESLKKKRELKEEKSVGSVRNRIGEEDGRVKVGPDEN